MLHPCYDLCNRHNQLKLNVYFCICICLLQIKIYKYTYTHIRAHRRMHVRHINPEKGVIL